MLVPADPTHSYPIARFRFDHSGSVRDIGPSPGSGAGLDRPVEIHLNRAWCISEDGLEWDFTIHGVTLSWGEEDGVGIALRPALDGATASAIKPAGRLATKDPDLPRGESSVPAAPTSWGRLKSSDLLRTAGSRLRRSNSFRNEFK